MSVGRERRRVKAVGVRREVDERIFVVLSRIMYLNMWYETSKYYEVGIFTAMREYRSIYTSLFLISATNEPRNVQSAAKQIPRQVLGQSAS